MPWIFKGFAAALVLLTLAASGAQAQDATEAKALAAWPKLAKRDGSQLLIMNHGGGTFSNTAFVFINGQGSCGSYYFTGVQRLFDSYTRRLEPVAELTCWTAEGPQQALVRDNGLLLTGRKLTASADGHYVFVEGRHVMTEDDHGKPIDLGMVASVEKWTIGANSGGGPFSVACTQSKPDGPSDFLAWCGESGRGFDARIADASPGKPDEGYKRWRIYNLSDPSDSQPYLNAYVTISTWNMGDPFVSTAREAEALARYPGLVRRDGPDLVVLDGGREVRRLRDEGGCTYWYTGKSADLYDARKNAVAPVAEILCKRGEFSRRILAPAYGQPLEAFQGYAASEDGKTVAVLYGSTDLIDWQSREVLLHYPLACRDLTARGNDHFSASCANRQGSDPRIAVAADFDRIDGVWKVTERSPTAQ